LPKQKTKKSQFLIISLFGLFMGKVVFLVVMLCFTMGVASNKVYVDGKRVQVGEVRVINGIECVLVKGPKGSKRFWINKNPITQKQYKDVMGDNSPYYTGNDNFPVENVSRNDAATFCQKVGGRLPTEDELKSASRGGGGTKFLNGLDRTLARPLALASGSSVPSAKEDPRNVIVNNQNDLAESLASNPRGLRVVFDVN
jgi:hypothetical protein